jgi:diaminopimelate epimerase
MNGLGNDFMVVEWPQGQAVPDPGLVRSWADRRCGVGFDHLLLVSAERPYDGDATYRIFNADGSEAEQSGNGVRCLALYLAPRIGPSLTLVGPAGKVAAKVLTGERVSVDLGEPNFEPSALPFLTQSREARYRLQLRAQSIEFGAVSIRNPHIVIAVDSVERAAVGTLGPELQQQACFPQGVNVGFMQRENERRIRLRVFERGSGETPACGTGAAAAVAVGRLWGELAAEIEVALPGGTLHVTWRGPGSTVWQTGSAQTVYEGKIEYTAVQRLV